MALTNTWTPKLGLDLQGGTTITLTAQNTTGTGPVDPEQPAAGPEHHPEPGRLAGRRRVRGHHRRRQAAHRHRAERPAGRTGRAGRPDRRAAVPCRLRRRAGDTARPSRAPTATGSPTPGARTDGRARRGDSPRPTSRAPVAGSRPPASRQQPTFPAAAHRAAATGRRGLRQRRRARARRPTRPWNGSRPSPARPPSPSSPAIQSSDDVADQPLFACNREGTEKYLLGPTLIEGDQLTTATAGIPQNNVTLGGRTWSSTPRARSAFENATRALSTKSGPAEPVRHRARRRVDLRSVGERGRSPADGPRSPATSPRRPRPSWPTS